MARTLVILASAMVLVAIGCGGAIDRWESNEYALDVDDGGADAPLDAPREAGR